MLEYFKKETFKVAYYNFSIQITKGMMSLRFNLFNVRFVKIY